MHFERVITFHQHIPAPIADADDEGLDFEIGWCLPWAEDFQDSLLCIFVFDGRTLLTLVPGNHVLHSPTPSLIASPSFRPRGGQVIPPGSRSVELYSEGFPVERRRVNYGRVAAIPSPTRYWICYRFEAIARQREGVINAKVALAVGMFANAPKRPVPPSRS